MPITLTVEHILALAPDPSSAQAGRGLATIRKWQQLGQSQHAVWGDCQGSGKDPYRVQVDLRELAFRCSCPSRKFPCKHGIALLLLLASQPAAIATGDPPAWVAEWLAKRDQSSAKRDEPAPSAPSVVARRSASRSKSAASREALVAAGVEELERWISDLIRQGFATIQNRPTGTWDAMAARMVDAQAPGLARMVRALARVLHSGAGWQDRLLERLARLHLLIEGYKRIDQLSPALQAEVRTLIGWAQDQEQVRATDGIRDTWVVLGDRIVEEDQLRSQRTWLWGVETERAALLLSFAAAGQPLDHTLVPGTLFSAELAFYQGAFPLRALIKSRDTAAYLAEYIPEFPTLTTAMAHYAAAVTANPWLDLFPCMLQQVVPAAIPDGWVVADHSGQVLPVTIAPLHGWRLLGISGGHPITLFGEWDGSYLTPISAWAEGQFVRFG